MSVKATNINPASSDIISLDSNPSPSKGHEENVKNSKPGNLHCQNSTSIVNDDIEVDEEMENLDKRHIETTEESNRERDNKSDEDDSDSDIEDDPLFKQYRKFIKKLY